MCVPPRLRVSYGYKRLVKEIFPRDVHSSEVQTLSPAPAYLSCDAHPQAFFGRGIERTPLNLPLHRLHRAQIPARRISERHGGGQVNAREMEKLTVYALTNTDKLAKIGLYIERRVGKKFARCAPRPSPIPSIVLPAVLPILPVFFFRPRSGSVKHVTDRKDL